MSEPQFNYIFVVTGFNCAPWVGRCLQSIINQKMKNWLCVAGDDGSTDNTFQVMKKYEKHPQITIFRETENRGACYMRWKAIQLLVDAGKISDNDVILLIGGDDWLAGHGVLTILHRYYSKGAEVTYGNWKTPGGQWTNKVGKFPKEVLKNRSYRKYKWTSTAINTFRYRLFKQIDLKDFKTKEGKWINNCTDLAVMFPVLELADPNKIFPVKEHIYIYNDRHSHTTLKRFGTAHKTRLNRYIRSLPKYPRKQA